MTVVKKWLKAFGAAVGGYGVITSTWKFMKWFLNWLGNLEKLASVKPYLLKIVASVNVHLPAHIPPVVLHPLFNFACVLIGGVALFISSRMTRPVRSEPMTLRQLGDQELYDQSVQWLSKRLSDKKAKVERAILFGSVVHDHFKTSDVDLIVVIKQMSDRSAGAAGRKLKKVTAVEFSQRFGHPLHLQIYLAREPDRLNKFLSGLGKYRELDLGHNQ